MARKPKHDWPKKANDLLARRGYHSLSKGIAGHIDANGIRILREANIRGLPQSDQGVIHYFQNQHKRWLKKREKGTKEGLQRQKPRKAAPRPKKQENDGRLTMSDVLDPDFVDRFNAMVAENQAYRRLLEKLQEIITKGLGDLDS